MKLSLPERKWERERGSPLYTPRYEYPPHRKRSIPKPQALITFVASTFAGNVTSVTAGPINCSGANLIVVIACDFATSAISGTLTDSTSANTYVPGNNISGGGNDNVAFWYAENATVSSSMTFTKTGAFPLIIVFAFAGTRTTSVLENENSAFGNSPLTLGAITPSENNEVLVTGIASSDAGDVYAINSGFSTPQGQAIVGGISEGGAGSYLIQTSAASASPTWSGFNTAGSATMGSFRVATAATGGPFLVPDLDGLSMMGRKQFRRLQ